MRAQLRGLLWLVAEERRAYAAGSIFVVVGIGSGLSYPWFVQRLIDEGVQQRRLERVDQIGLILAALLIAEGIATVFRDYFFNMAGERVTARLRRRVFDHLLHQEIAFFDREKTGEMTTRLWADIPALARVAGEPFADALRFALFGVCGIGLLFYTSPVLTALVLLVVPPIVVASSFFGARVKRYTSEVQSRYAQSGAIAEQSLAGIRTVRAFSQERAEGRRFAGHIDAALAIARRKIIAVGLLSGFSFTLGEGAALIAIWAGGRLIVRGQLTEGALISFVLYAFLVARGFRNATEFWSETLRALGSTEWIFALLSRGGLKAAAGAPLPEPVRGAVTLDNLRFRYPSRSGSEALAGVTLAVDPGEVVAFVGRSGAGKSTILNLLLRFYEPGEGRILLDGRDIREFDPGALRRRIGVVLQDPVVFSGTIADNIRYGRPDATDAEVAAAAGLASARDFIERLADGFSTAIGDRGVQLSGGQRQRLAIARAVLRQPAILVLDEATSALDGESETFVHDALRALPYQPTTLVIAHRLSTVMSVSRVVVLDRGRIVGVGPHAELLGTCPLYRQLVESQLVTV
jgi:ATP-binding cassette subfamily B protein